MEKLERVRRMTYRRMDQVDSELERFEERPELDTLGRSTLLLKRLVELEKLYYNLLRKQAPSPYDLIERILEQHSRPVVVEPEFLVSRSALNIRFEGTAYGN